MRRIKVMVLIAVFCALACVACGKKKTDKPVESDAKESEENVEEKETDTQIIVGAVKNASELPSFQLDTQAFLSLNGKLIKGDYHLQSEIQIVQNKEKSKLEMTARSTSDIDDTVSKAYYKDGWYYTDDANGKNKVQKSAEEVLVTVGDVTNIVVEASDKIYDIQVDTEDGNTVYTYQISSYLAEEYLTKLSESAAAETPDLAGAKVEVETVQLVTVVDNQGKLVRQEMQMTGAVIKSIFKVPAEAEVSAAFTETDKKELEIPVW